MEPHDVRYPFTTELTVLVTILVHVVHTVIAAYVVTAAGVATAAEPDILLIRDPVVVPIGIRIRPAVLPEASGPVAILQAVKALPGEALSARQ